MNVIESAAVLCGGVTAAGLMALVRPRPPRASQRIRPYTVTARAALGLPSDAIDLELRGRSGTEAVLIAPLRAAAIVVGRVMESRTDEAIALRLYQAGRADSTPNDFRMLQVTRAVCTGALLGFGALLVVRSTFVVVTAAVCGFVAGAARVRGQLDRSIAERAQRMETELYTINQLLALHVRSGAGPIQAVQRVVDRTRGAVADELASVLVWIRSGQRESVAFQRAGELTPCPSAARTYQMFALASERGTDLGEALISVGDDLRNARRESLRRYAVRNRAAMLAPTIGILAPIMLLFVAAPLPSIVLGGR